MQGFSTCGRGKQNFSGGKRQATLLPVPHASLTERVVGGTECFILIKGVQGLKKLRTPHLMDWSRLKTWGQTYNRHAHVCFCNQGF